jgi:acid phosphatase
MSFNFYTIGDWGKLNKSLLNVANSMDLMSLKIKPDCILSLGDNFYPNGVSSTDDPLWNSVYTNVFKGTNLSCPWYSILGNHDYLSNPNAQIDYYTEKKDSRWTMPAKYYSIIYQLENKKVQIVALDTVELGILTSATLISEKQLNKTGINMESRNVQIKWLDNVLSTSDADWLIVMGHYNMYTAGYHESNHELISLLKPMFVKYNVDMYLCGHCHNLEHLSDSNIEYIVSGSGAKTGNVGKIFQSKYGTGENGYTIHQINNSVMTTLFINQESKILYQFELKQKRNL